jgi:hypothetical protein
MAKKTKRQVRKAPSGSVLPSSAPTTTGNGRTYEREFNPDYTPVIKDLRRIGILAGSFFAVLILLSFFLR